MIVQITSRSNPRVKDLLKERDKYYIFEGEKLVRDILARGLEIDKLIVNENVAGSLSLQGQPIRETWYVNDPVLEKISRLKEKPDIIAVMSLKTREIDFKRGRTIIVLDNAQDPGNTGTIFRCAAAFGMDGIALCGASVNPNNPRFLRAAQTSIFDVPYQSFDRVEDVIGQAERENIRVYLTGAHPTGPAIGFNQVVFPCLVLFGNEGQGLEKRLFSLYPTISIPQDSRVESLNVGVSACIIMHELRKRGV